MQCTDIFGLYYKNGFVIYGFHTKLMCWFQPVEVPDNSNKTLGYYSLVNLALRIRNILLQAPG